MTRPLNGPRERARVGGVGADAERRGAYVAARRRRRSWLRARPARIASFLNGCRGLRVTERAGLSKSHCALQTGPAPFPCGLVFDKLTGTRAQGCLGVRCVVLSVATKARPVRRSASTAAARSSLPFSRLPPPAAGLPVICNACHGENPPGMKFCRAVARRCCRRCRRRRPTARPGWAILRWPGSFRRRCPRQVSRSPAAGPHRARDLRVRSRATCHHSRSRPARSRRAARSRARAAVPQPRWASPTASSAGSISRGSRRPIPARSRVRGHRPRSRSAASTPRVPRSRSPTRRARRGRGPAPGPRCRSRCGCNEPSARAGIAWGTAVLVNRDGSDGQRFSLSSEDTVVGRAGAEIAFDDDRFLAQQHARIERGGDGSVRIHALDTLNGVFKKADAPVELVDGATILVGREVLRFEKLAPEETDGAPARAPRRGAVRFAAARAVGPARTARAVGRLSRRSPSRSATRSCSAARRVTSCSATMRSCRAVTPR